MKVTFKYSKEIELRKLLFHLVEIQKGFFREHGFYLTTEVNESYSNFVVIPLWEELQSEKLWTNIARLANQMKKDPLYYLKTDLNDFETLKSKIDVLENINTSEFEEEWNSIKNEVIEYCNSNLSLKDINLEVYITRFGTKCSYALSDTKVISMPINSIKYLNSNIVFSLLSSTIHEYADDQKHNVSWKEKQIAIDSVIKSTKLATILQEYRNVVDDIKMSNIGPKLIKENDEIYNFLGLGNSINVKFIKDKILINDKEIEFTTGEANVFKLIYKNRDRATTYEKIADLLWSDHIENKFSLEAINKKIERIRKKIKASGINSQVIRTRNGIGYCF